MQILKAIIELHAQGQTTTLNAIAFAIGQNKVSILSTVAELLLYNYISPGEDGPLSSDKTEYFITDLGRLYISKQLPL